MWILIIYAALVVAGETGVVMVGLMLDKIYPALSLLISMTLFFIVFGLSWPLAIRLTPGAAR
jgi:hypothetical protein